MKLDNFAQNGHLEFLSHNIADYFLVTDEESEQDFH